MEKSNLLRKLSKSTLSILADLVLTTVPERNGLEIPPLTCKSVFTSPLTAKGDFTLRVSKALATVTDCDRAVSLNPFIVSMMPLATNGILP